MFCCFWVARVGARLLLNNCSSVFLWVVYRALIWLLGCTEQFLGYCQTVTLVFYCSGWLLGLCYIFAGVYCVVARARAVRASLLYCNSNLFLFQTSVGRRTRTGYKIPLVVRQESTVYYQEEQRSS